MERVQGIGGHFLRAKDPAALTAWYRDVLGLGTDEYGQWQQAAGPTVFAAFDADSEDMGPATQQVMFNFRVADLEAMLAQLSAAGSVVEEPQEMEGVGLFAYVTDPEGNRIELWQPS